MTALELTVYIALAILVQITVFAALALYRRWRVYGELKSPSAGCGAGQPDTTVYPAAQVASWVGFRDFRVVRKIFEDPNHSVCSLHLAPVDGSLVPDFKPGQFLTFRLNVADPREGSGKEIIRCYSLSDRPGTDHYRISVKRVPSPAGSAGLPPGLSSNHLHDAVQEGDVLSARAPIGHFVLEQGDGPIVLIAGGIGITPMLSMLNASLLNGDSREIWLFYGARNSAEHVMKEHLEALARAHPNFQLHVCYSNPLPDDAKDSDYQHAGHVDFTLLRRVLPEKPYCFYVCGPRAMMEALVPALDDWGVPERNIRYEAFGPASLARQKDQNNAADDGGLAAALLTVNFSKSGKSFVWDGSADSLLDFAEKHGVDVTSGCRAGGCGSCQTVMEAGEVEYLHAPDFDPDPGSCLLCTSRPKTDLTLLA